MQIPFRWAALRGRYYVHLVQMHGPFPNSVRVGAPLFGGLSLAAKKKRNRNALESSERKSAGNTLLQRVAGVRAGTLSSSQRLLGLRPEPRALFLQQFPDGP